MFRWLIFGVLTLTATSCRHVPEASPFHLQDDVYLIVTKPCSSPARNAIVPVNSGFFERSLTSGLGWEIVIFPTPQEFYDNPGKWKCWRFAYPLASGMYRLVDLIPGGTTYHPVDAPVVMEEDGIVQYAPFSQIILDEGPYKGMRLDMQFMNDHVELPEQFKDDSVEIGQWEEVCPV